MYTHCKTGDDVHSALSTLSQAARVFLDCEGDYLGYESGLMTVISIGAAVVDSDEMPIFLFDLTILNKDALHPLFDGVLANAEVEKIVFDGRMDQSALLHEHGVTLVNVVDLQLVDVQSRALRGEKPYQQQGRLIAFLPRNEVKRNSSMYVHVHKLDGLAHAIRQHKVKIDKELPALKDSSRTLNWRVVDEAMLVYSANDIKLIAALHAYFDGAGYLRLLGSIRQQSARYIALWVTAPRIWGDEYRSHGLLPLAVLEETSSLGCRICSGCKRALPQSAFPKSAWAKPSRKCWVCRAVDVRLRIRGNENLLK